MVKVKEKSPALYEGPIDIEVWLQHIASKQKYLNMPLIRNAVILTQLASGNQPSDHPHSSLLKGLAVADILSDFELDSNTLAAAIVYESFQLAEITLEDIREHVDPLVAKLVEGVARMNSISLLRRQTQHRSLSHQQADNLRKMLIAMVDNIQVVLIKLAERLHTIRYADMLPTKTQEEIAQEAMEIYAPLANRLGIGHIKWQLEDLAFRYLQHDTYKKIAKGLKTRRIERDQFVQQIVDLLKRELSKHGIHHFEVYGRSKHIYSIYRKMQRKNVDVNEIYDATAVRILVNTLEECYQVLSIVHQLWQPIEAEFDDYISRPKENGYRSLHTAVMSADQRVFEVQIRTHQMHDLAEMGVAAHWVYKEGGLTPQAGHERKIAWLRQVLDWQRELLEQIPDIDPQPIEALEDRIYVFTPTGDIVDLPRSSTPLDFAYYIHSEIGHRCRGAKVDGNIVPLTYRLKTGEQVSILTANQPKPSRDWLNPQLNYLTTTRAKAKVMQWFRQQDYEKHRQMGQTILEKELKRNEIAIHLVNYEKLAHSLHFKTASDLFAGIGRGDTKVVQVIQHWQEHFASTANPPPTSAANENIPTGPSKATKSNQQSLEIAGIDNLLSRLASCCKPIPGDEIIGYITQGQGVTIHRKDCTNVTRLIQTRSTRLIEVSWAQHPHHYYQVDISIIARDRQGLVRDVSTMLAADKLNITSALTKTDPKQELAFMTFTVEVQNMETLDRILDHLKNMPDVLEVKRVS